MRHTVALLRDISRGSLIVETATKVFRDTWHANQTYTCSYGIKNVPIYAWMLEQPYSMYALKINRGGGGDCFDTQGVEHRDFKSDSTFKEVFVAFMKRTSSRVLIGNPVDGHCGINCLQHFFALLVPCRRIDEQFPRG